MGHMKRFIMEVSEDMGHYGEINDEVLEEAQERLAGLIDKTYDELNDPDSGWDPDKEYVTEDMLVEFGGHDIKSRD
tara:strand:+ start:135 stop:362 length:228 start_codon:yes stop_codon:yes gene_type:complete